LSHCDKKIPERIIDGKAYKASTVGKSLDLVASELNKLPGYGWVKASENMILIDDTSNQLSEYETNRYLSIPKYYYTDQSGWDCGPLNENVVNESSSNRDQVWMFLQR